jgi:hypothetical protein
MKVTSDSAKRSPVAFRFGVMCYGPVMRQWEVQSVRHLLDAGLAEPVLVIIDASQEGKRIGERVLEQGRPHGQPFGLGLLLNRCRALVPTSLEPLLSGITRIECEPVEDGPHAGHFSTKDVAAIADHRLDFILRFAFTTIRGDVLNIPRYGIWSFLHGRHDDHLVRAPLFREMYGGESVVRVLLERLTDERESTTVLREGYVNTIKHSYGQSIDNVYFEAARWPARQCRVLLRTPERAGKASAPLTGAKKHVEPDLPEAVILALKLLRNLVKTKLQALFCHPQWNIGIVRAPVHRFLDPGALPEPQYLPGLRKGTLRADPFGLMRNGRLTLLFEEVDYESSKGIITAVQVAESGAALSSQKVFDLPFHMSYPYLFEHDGQVYCVPETAENRRISLFAAADFPKSWEKVTDIGEGVSAIDTTVFNYEGRWWIAFTDREEGADLSLFLWYGQEVTGPWTPHALNPVKTDARSSRPGGTPFLHKGILYRPAQDCSESYGAKIVINRVRRLTPDEFEEEPAAVVEPQRNGPFPDGLHTLSSVGEITVLDALRTVFVPVQFKRAVTGGTMKAFRFLKSIFRGGLSVDHGPHR